MTVRHRTLFLLCFAAMPVFGPAQTAMYPVSGTVVDADTHSALPGTEVVISPIGKPQLIETAITDASGRFQFGNLFAGKYILSAARPGYLQSSYLQHGMYSTGVKVGPGLPSTGLVFPLRRRASISGTVTDQDNEPVPNAHITLLRQAVTDGLRTITHAATASTGEDGKYRLGNLQPGIYFMFVLAQPWYTPQYMVLGRRGAVESASSTNLDTAYPISYFPGVSSDDAAAPIRLGPGSHVEANLSLTAVPAVHVTIQNAIGARGNTSIQATNHWGFPIRMNSAYFSNMGQLFNLAPGRYEVTAAWLDREGRHAGRKVIDIGSSLTIDPKSLEGSPGVTATIIDTGGGASGPRTLALRDLNTMQVLNPQPGRRGAIHWAEQQLGSNRLELMANGENVYIARVTAKNAKVTGRIIQLGQGTATLTVTLGHGLGILDGRVASGNEALPGAMVLLLPDGFGDAPSLIRRDQSDSDGTFSLTGIAPGTYTLLALPVDEDLEYANPSVMQPYLARGKKLTIQPGMRYSETIEVSSGKR